MTAKGLHEVLGVDLRGISAPYRGPRLHEDIPERGVKVDNWGIHRRWIEHDTGGYWDFCDFPLRNAGEETVADWPMPSPDDHDYSGLREACERYEELRHIYRGGQAWAASSILPASRVEWSRRSLIWYWTNRRGCC